MKKQPEKSHYFAQPSKIRADKGETNILNSSGSAFQRAEIVRSINRNSDEGIIVLVVEQAPNDFIWTYIQKAYPPIRLCNSNKNPKKM